MVNLGDTLSISERAKEFDKNGKYRRKIDNALELLEQFRQIYPFKDCPESIDSLTADDLFKDSPPKVGDFFRWIEFRLKPLGHLSVYSNAYRNARNKLEDFRALLRIAVDEEKSLAEKVDAPWERISRMGGDKHIAKKIISCYDDNVLPVFKTADLEHFFNLFAGNKNLPSNYDSLSLGEKYQFLNQALLNVKERVAETKKWDNIYFMWFLYVTYKWRKPAQPKPTSKSRSFFEPQIREEVIFPLSQNIEKTYESIKKCAPLGRLVDSLEVVKQVEEYRQFWKPKEIRVILLAESHVHTDKQDYEIKCNRLILDKLISDYPTNFVRFVYCLGYGENQLLNRSIKNNRGTTHYWKIFSSCVAENENDLGFHKVLKTRASFMQRIRNKVNILQNMRKKGIWLVDASIVGIYRSGIKNPKTIKRIIEICWENHLAKMIKESQPRHIIVIGKRVQNILGSELQKLDFPITVVRQPQGDRRNSHKQLEKYRKCQRICARYC